MSDWVRPWVAPDTVTALPDAGAEFMIGDEDAPNDVINRTALQLNGWLEELASSGLGNNLIRNGSFESWSLGTANQAPDGFSKKGAPTDVSRDTGERDGFGGSFAAKITSNGAGNEGLTITLSNLKASTSYFLSVRAKATAGDTARIWSTGGSTNIDTNTASTSFVTLSGEIITDATPTNIVLNFGSNTATDIVWFDKLMIQEGEVPAVFLYHHNDQHIKGIDFQSTAPANFTYGLFTVQVLQVTVAFAATNRGLTVVTWPQPYTKFLGAWANPESGINAAASAFAQVEAPSTTGASIVAATRDNSVQTTSLTVNVLVIGIV